jgi:hypothetical protein
LIGRELEMGARKGEVDFGTSFEIRRRIPQGDEKGFPFGAPIRHMHERIGCHNCWMVKDRQRVQNKRGQAQGRRSVPGPSNEQHNPAPSIGVERPDTNGRVAIIVVNEFADTDPRSGVSSSPAGYQGVYDVHFIFGVPGNNTFRENFDLTHVLDWGDSLLMVGQANADVRFVLIRTDPSTTGTVDVLMRTNSAGALARAYMAVEAGSFVDAERVAFNHVSAVLSKMSFDFDVAIEINGSVVVARSTESTRWTFGWAGKRKSFGATMDSTGILSIGLAESRLFSTYREGLNATNPFHQALTFYKVTEGVQGLRGSRRQAAKEAGAPIPHDPTEQLPTDPKDLGIADEGIRSMFRPYLGRSFGYALNKLRKTVRNAVAHMDPDAGYVLSADNFDEVLACVSAAEVLKYIARQMLKNEFPTT